VLILSSTVFLGQTVIDSNANSGVILTLNEANFFINQVSQNNYLKIENFNLNEKDSLNQITLRNSRNIINNYDSIVYDQGQIINDKNRIIGLTMKEVSNVMLINTNLKVKVKRNRRAAFAALGIIIVQSVLISALLY